MTAFPYGTYHTSASATVAPDENSEDWTETIPSYDETKPNYWSREVTTLSDGSVTYSTPILAQSLNVDFLNTIGLTAKKISVETTRNILDTDGNKQFDEDGNELKETKTIFEADSKQGTVQIGGFKVSDTAIYSEKVTATRDTPETSMLLQIPTTSTDGKQVNGSIRLGNTFAVEDTGSVFARDIFYYNQAQMAENFDCALQV